MVATGQVVCPSNADTVVVAAANVSADGSVAENLGKRQVWLTNPSAQGVYLGSSAETAATGFLLAAGASVGPLELELNDAIYGRGASSSPTVHFIETGT